MLKIRCITMQKNETYLLEAWIKYYAYLFGIENVYILDNGSTKEETKALLALYAQQGCHIVYQYNAHDDFESKGEIIGNIIKSWDEQDTYDFVIPIDIDEFIILHKNYPSCDKEKIHDYFQSLIGIQDAFIMQESYLNIYGEAGFFSPTRVPKCFFASKTIQSLDHGFHHPVSKYSSVCKYTQLAYLHFHNRSFQETLELAKEKLSQHVDIHNLPELKEYEGPGGHLVKYFFMTEREYNFLYIKNGNVYFYELLQLFLSLNIDIKAVFGGEYLDINPTHPTHILIRYPNINRDDDYLFGYFDRDHYLLANKDVQQEEMDPILHFCLHGFVDEDRLANAFQATCSVPRYNFIRYISNPNNIYIFNLKLKQI